MGTVILFIFNMAISYDGFARGVYKKPIFGGSDRDIRLQFE